MSGSNSVVNGSFEDSGAGAQPAHWEVSNISGSSVATVIDVADAPDGDLAAQVFSNQVSSHYLYSAPIPVSIGEIWSLAAFVGGEYFGGGVQTADAALVALWFANDTNLYPTTSNPDILIQATLNLPQHPPYQTLSGNVTAPVTGFMRVCLQSNIDAPGQAVIWDNVSARRA